MEMPEPDAGGVLYRKPAIGDMRWFDDSGASICARPKILEHSIQIGYHELLVFKGKGLIFLDGAVAHRRHCRL
jgi:hypothetical protein